nr:integrase, catalytic region, zinc finger, CCHC-type, peptidase aspartic, catalytic [Tanacetum cinerariifolium]
MSNTNNTMQTQTLNTLHNAIMEVGGKDRLPMLAPGNYVQWKSIIKRYINTKPNHELIHYCLKNPPYKYTWAEKVVLVSEGSSEITTERFTSRDGDSLESYYSRFYKMMNELVRNQCDVTNHQVNVQFLLQLQPEWQRFMILVKQSQELKTVSYHKLYDILKQHQNDVNEIRAERLASTANPLALVAQQQPVYHPQNYPTHYTQNSSTRTQQATTRNRGKAIEKEIDKLMALISLSFKKIYKPTNKNLRTSSNTSRADQDNSPRISRGNGYENQRIGNVAGARETVGTTVVQKSRIQCYNCKEFRHVARECQKLKRAKGAAYHKEKMLLCKQEEAGFQLNAEQADWRHDTDDESEDQELEAHYMYMAQIQEVTPDAVDNSRPIFDFEPLQKVSNDDNYNVFAIETPEFKEEIRLEKENRSKLSDLIRPFDYKKLNNLYDLFVPQREKSSAQQQPVYHPQNHPTHYTQNSSTRTQQATTRNRGKAIDNSPRISRANGYENQRIGNVVGARETVGTTVVQKSRIQCYNCKEFRHVARECQKLKRAKGAAYHKEKMLLCKQEEVGFQLNAEQADWRHDTDDESEDQELEAHYMYMAQIQEVTPDAADNFGPIFDFEPLQKVSNDDNYNAFAIESEYPKQSKSVNDTYPIEQDEHNIIIDSLDISYDTTDMKKELFAHQETISILSQAKEAQLKFHKTREDKELDRVIALENKVKVLDNIVYKTVQSIQTMNILNRNYKKSFVKPEFLKKAQRVNPRLYDIGCYNDNLALMLAPEFEEEIRLIRLEKENRSKLSDLIRPFDYKKLNNLYDLFVPQREKSNAILGVYTELDEVTNLQSDMCVLQNFNGVNSRTKMPMVVPISTRKPKRIVNQSVAKPLRKTVASNSTNQKPRHTTRKLYEHVSKACSLWYPKFTPPGYKCKTKSQIGNVDLNLVDIILIIVDSGCSKHMTGNLKLLINFVEKFLGTVKFRNDQIAHILGYGDLVQ